MKTPTFAVRLLLPITWGTVVVACGQSSSGGSGVEEPPGTLVGGASAIGASLGGTKSSGGGTNTSYEISSGAPGAGGVTPTSGSGGTNEAGGRVGVGGTHAAGGVVSVTGGATSIGGSDGTGGTSNLGGTSSAGDVAIIPDPSWACGMPNGIPAPSSGELVFRATFKLGATHDVGITQYGHRRILDVKSGTLAGPRVNATALTGGLDLELTLSNGTIELEQIYVLRASDDTLIYMRNCGVAPASDNTVRVVADFEVANSKSLAWLNTGKYVGTRVVDAVAGTLQLDVYEVSKVTVSAPKVQLKDPTGVPNVSWDCLTGTGTKGTTVFTENVTLGSSLTVGASKRGSRNIIPITGGTTTGNVKGAVLAGGGDYQLSGLDARYTLAPNDGEFILVRNCGPIGALVPSFEARAAGPYAYLNANSFISSNPDVGSGGVSITFSERK